ncbi:MAG: LysR family transcriptional regulator [Pseudomonadota bacterium]
MDRLRTLHCFRKIAERGSFAAAARDLHMSPGAMTKHINALEDQLGVQLISRTTRRLSLTEAGEAYLARITGILDDLNDADETVRDLTDGPRGRVRISAPMSFGILKLSPVIADLLIACPDLSVDLTLDDSFVDIIDEGYDITLRIRESLPNSSLIVRRICDYSRVLCASPAYLAAAPPLNNPEDLVSHNCLVYSNGDRPGTWVFAQDGVEKTIDVAGRFSVNSSLAMRDALLQGCGLTLTPRLVVEDLLADGRLVSLLDDFTPRSLSLYAISAPHRHRLRKIRTVIDFLSKKLRSETK